MPKYVKFKSTQIVIDGTPRILLCASLFPFRIPHDQWLQRLQAVKKIGYHAIDVYVPWNFYEQSPGIWNFEGQHDIEEFLHLAHATGLYVLVRPGPYICSEWDGGGIPAWIETDPKMKIRQNDPEFLAAVRSWFNKVMPIVERQQYGVGGSVIMVQVDNELDFFNCNDPRAYIDTLARMMKDYGITIPIVACAGQGDYERAFGGSRNVVPAVNIYPDDNGVDVDACVRYYRKACDNYDVPMIVTETNRLHRTLRRLVGGGAKFVSPYLQVSGWDFDYATSVNNWGHLEAFMTHDYDFGGVIDPSGAERPDADDARRLSAIINALGERLASAVPSANPLDYVESEDGSPFDEQKNKIAVNALNLLGGGQLLTITNLSHHDNTLKIREHSSKAGCASHTLRLPADIGIMVLREMPIGPDFTVVASDAEPVKISDNGVTLSPPIPSKGDVWAVLRIQKDSSHIMYDVTGNLSVHRSDDEFTISGSHGSILFKDEMDSPSFMLKITQPQLIYIRPSSRVQTLTSIGTSNQTVTWSRPSYGKQQHQPQYLETAGVYTGAGRYRGHVINNTRKRLLGVVLHNAADIIPVHHDHTFTDWSAAHGDVWIPFGDSDDACDDLEIITRVWGHSNFDDNRLESLKLTAHRGLSGVIAVTKINDFNSGWLTCKLPNSIHIPWLTTTANMTVVTPPIGTKPMPRSDLGSRTVSSWPNVITYIRTLAFEDTAAALRIENGQSRCDIFLNDRFIGTATPLQPVVCLGVIHSGDRLCIVITKTWGENTGNISMLTGFEISDWDLHSQGLRELRDALDTARFSHADLPIHVPTGKGIWVNVPAKKLEQSVSSLNTVVRMKGEGIQLTAFTSHYCLGRVILGPLPGTVFAGGRGDYFLVPRDEGDLALFVESTRSHAGILKSIVLGEPLDLNPQNQ